MRIMSMVLEGHIGFEENGVPFKVSISEDGKWLVLGIHDLEPAQDTVTRRGLARLIMLGHYLSHGLIHVGGGQTKFSVQCIFTNTSVANIAYSQGATLDVEYGLKIGSECTALANEHFYTLCPYFSPTNFAILKDNIIAINFAIMSFSLFYKKLDIGWHARVCFSKYEYFTIVSERISPSIDDMKKEFIEDIIHYYYAEEKRSYDWVHDGGQYAIINEFREVIEQRLYSAFEKLKEGE